MRYKMMIRLLATALLPCFGWSAGAQETMIQGIPAGVYYLMPSFGEGMVYLHGQSPARGRMNICALDNTLRFLDKDGKELEAGQGVDIVKVRIDSVVFVRIQNVFYRIHPLTEGLGIAQRRDVRILHDAKEGAYGTVSQTTSVQEYGVIYADGIAHNLKPDKPRPYSVSDLFYAYREGDLVPLTRKGLRKLFPDKKEEIDAFFKAGHAEPKTTEEALSLLSRWAE